MDPLSAGTESNCIALFKWRSLQGFCPGIGDANPTVSSFLDLARITDKAPLNSQGQFEEYRWRRVNG
jgi:hypothetical protein